MAGYVSEREGGFVLDGVGWNEMGKGIRSDQIGYCVCLIATR